MISPYRMPRDEWASVLEGRGHTFERDAEELETCAELWRKASGEIFAVPYELDEEGERRIVSFALTWLVSSL